jgi:hypothetical protein
VWSIVIEDLPSQIGPLGLCASLCSNTGANEKPELQWGRAVLDGRIMQPHASVIAATHVFDSIRRRGKPLPLRDQFMP